MDSKEMHQDSFVDASSLLGPRRLIGVITSGISGEQEGQVLDMLEVAVESIGEGFTPEGTNVIVAEAQLRALRKPRTITWG